ncbi:hypothetical protein [Roseivirga sp.]|uniref:hypothetical protein n=1 Tax=Roseivirga sp. TaxID=1964215 RepID=UPI003BAC6594
MKFLLSRLLTWVLFISICTTSIKGQGWSSMVYGFKDAHLHEHTFMVDDYTDLRLSLVFRKTDNGTIKLDTIVSTLTGLLIGIEVFHQGLQLTQNSEENTVYWSLPVSLRISGLSIVESLLIKGELNAFFTDGSNQPEVESYIYNKPEIGGSFIFVRKLYVYQFFLMIVSFFLMSFHRNINRIWLFIVLFITPVIGPAIYILNRITKALLIIRNRIKTSNAVNIR